LSNTDSGLVTAFGTVDDVRSGTSAYQAPGQMIGRDLTACGDLFALG
jgi:hypothetical protein